ncbi:hypothetical protein CXY01_35930 [Cellulomonas xylanilytica]|uniref:Uncharacterized protein n=2 Tax=Cellulomonas xylanilytica TaxID=233583 RepID=A0A510V867_9CELL|nr:hypothetical protein CXY01_35930 [Cellulomonas xylanilytica]
MIATPAQAADFTIHSTTWKSSVYYNDSANTLRLCDVVDRDGDGAHISTSLGHSTWVYNGCTWLQNIPDGVRLEVDVCDWIYMTSNRNAWYCQRITVTA